MSGALYKYLQKAVLEGREGAPEVMERMTARARLAIMDKLARAKGGDMGHLMAEELPQLGDKAKEMLSTARDDLLDLPAIKNRSVPLQGEANELFYDWKDKPVGGWK